MRLERAINDICEKKEIKKVKKLSMIAALTMTFVLGFAMSAFAALNLDKTVSPVVTTSPTITEINANLPANAPSTGDPVGTDPVTRIHQNYADNTNACASCHATHTAVGADLLQWDGVFETCMACHDGSAGVATYDVATGTVAATSAITSGGRFYTATNPAVTGRSIHNVEGMTGVKINTAPGGAFDNNTDNSGVTSGAGSGVAWGANFECTSCHNPHGNGGNFRLLDPNVNGFASLHKATNKAAVDVSALATPALPAKSKFVVEYQANDVNGGNAFNANFLTAPRGFSIKVFTDAAGSTALDATKYTIATEDDHTVINVSDPSALTNGGIWVTGNVGLKVKGNISGYLTADEKVTYVNGFNDFCGGCHTDYNTSIYNSASGVVTPPALPKSGWTYNLNGVTTDYRVARHAVDAPTGVYSKAYRHTVGFNAGAATSDGHGGLPVGLKFEERTVNVSGTPTGELMMSCMTCHVAHGTDTGYWTSYSQLKPAPTSPAFGANNTYYAGTETFDDTAANVTAGVNTRGSDLKRMPNMGACEACHDKSTPAQGYNITDNKN